MKYIPTDPILFIQNRERLVRLMLPGSAAIINSNDIMPTNADGSMRYHQNSDI